MRYVQLSIEVIREQLDCVKSRLETAGFDEMIINDPSDFMEIKEHLEWYKYDYINEEFAGHSDDKPEITLYFSDDEEGRAEAERAAEIVETISQETEAISQEAENALANAKGSAARIASGKSFLKWELSTTCDDSEWLYKWQEHFKPTKAGERIVVKPGWESYDAKPGELVIEMDPGMAFGSGLHETTTLCIKALERFFAALMMADRGSNEKSERADGSSRQLENEAGMPCPEVSDPRSQKLAIQKTKVLDVGCGTGILAIAAALLGADECLGIDIDSDAVRIAEENIKRNGLSGKIKAVQGDLTDGVDYHPDILVANLMADLVIRLAPAAAEHLSSGGVFISSGILDVKAALVADAVRAAGFRIEAVMQDGEWCAIVAKRV